MASMVVQETIDLPKLARVTPKWDATRLHESLTCPLSGEAARPSKLRRPDGLPLAYCESSKLWFVCKRPTPDLLGEIYDNYFNDLKVVRFDETYENFVRATANSRFQKDIRIVRLGVVCGGLSGKKALDVGCGAGEFMQYLKCAGADVSGTDVSQDAVRFVRDRLGFECEQTFLEELNVADETYDLITMIDVIEHPLNPMSLLTAAHRLLKPGGIMMLWTPNGGAAGNADLEAMNWVGFRVDLEHMQYLSPGSMQWAANRLNMDIEHMETIGFPGLGPQLAPHRPRAGRFAKFRTALHRAPWLVNGLRAIRDGANRAPDQRTGNYHLFTILRKCS